MCAIITGFTNANRYANQQTFETKLTQLWQVIVERVKEIPVEVFESGIQANNIEALIILVDYTKTTSKCIEKLCTCNNKLVKNIIDKMFLQKVQITTEALNNALKSKSVEIALSFLNMGIQPNITSLKNACSIRDVKLIQMILLCKLTPNKECFKALFDSYHSYNSTKESTEVANLIDMLVQHGYIVTYDDVITALEHKCKINNIKRFNIKFDGKFLEKCSTSGYYPYTQKEIGVSPTIECLRIESGKAGNTKVMKELVKSGLKPDIECLRNACKNRNNITNIRYIVEKHNIKPDVQCVKNIVRTLGNKTLDYLIGVADFNQGADTDKQKVVFTDEEQEEDDDEDEEEAEVKKEKEEEDEDEEKEDEVVNKEETSVKKPNKNLDKDEEDEDEDVEEELIKYNILDLSDSNIKIDQRKKYSLMPEIAEMLKVKKTIKMSFLDIRSNFMKYVVDNKLVNDSNKNMIKLDAILTKFLKAGKDQHITFSTLDNLIYKFLKI